MSLPKSIGLLSDQSIRLSVRAKPGAKKSAIVSIDDEAIGIQIAAPPREGAANEELIDFMSHVLGVKSRCVTLDAGSKSRNKALIITGGKTAEEVFHLVKSAIDDK